MQTILTAAEYLSSEYITSKILTLLGDADKIGDELIKVQDEQMSRFAVVDDTQAQDAPPIDEAVEAAEDATKTALNGAQTQSLIAIITQYSTGTLTENQAVNLIATSIGITKDEARAIIRGE